MEMFRDLRQFDEAKKWAEEYGSTRGESSQVSEGGARGLKDMVDMI